MEKYILLANQILRELCVIPAPSYHEEKRAKYCLEKLRSFGIEAFADKAGNVICQWSGLSAETVVIETHLDVVFGDVTPLPLWEDEEKLYCPGCGDNTVSAALLLSVLKKLKDENKKPQKNVVFVFNTCEEGLGNLKGTKTVMEKYGQNTAAFITFDGQYDAVVNKSVGSHRYKVTVRTEGGHSFNDFGKQNAALVLAQGIEGIYGIKLPSLEGKTTYNVGVVEGGTSVNTIVQEASMLCEYRSDNAESLDYMKEEFQKVFAAMAQRAKVEIELVGERPCMRGVDEKAQEVLTALCRDIQEKYSGAEVAAESGSTDCNIPHSMGIPAVCAGTYLGGGAHTREEWLLKDSIKTGFQIVNEIVERCFE